MINPFSSLLGELIPLWHILSLDILTLAKLQKIADLYFFSSPKFYGKLCVMVTFPSHLNYVFDLKIWISLGGFFHWRFTHEKTPQKDFYTSVWKITIFLNSKQKVLKKVLYTSVIRTLRSTELVLLYAKLYYHDHKVPKVFFLETVGRCGKKDS